MKVDTENPPVALARKGNASANHVSLTTFCTNSAHLRYTLTHEPILIKPA